MLGLWLRNLLRRPLSRPMNLHPQIGWPTHAASRCYFEAAVSGALQQSRLGRSREAPDLSHWQSHWISVYIHFWYFMAFGCQFFRSGSCGPEAEPSSPKWESKTFLWADICWKVKWLCIGLALGKGRCEASARFCKSSFFVAKQDHFWVKMTSDQGQPGRSDVKIVLYSS